MIFNNIETQLDQLEQSLIYVGRQNPAWEKQLEDIQEEQTFVKQVISNVQLLDSDYGRKFLSKHDTNIDKLNSEDDFLFKYNLYNLILSNELIVLDSLRYRKKKEELNQVVVQTPKNEYEVNQTHLLNFELSFVRKDKDDEYFYEVQGIRKQIDTIPLILHDKINEIKLFSKLKNPVTGEFATFSKVVKL